MMRVARAMVMVTKWAMATGGNNTGNGDGKEGGEQATAATMAGGKRATAATMAMGMGTTQRTWPLTLRLERGG
jgi:hypothetical protein